MLWYLHLELALHKIKMYGKIHADAWSYRFLRRTRSSRHSACKGVPIGPRMPWGQVQTHAGPWGPYWMQLSTAPAQTGCRITSATRHGTKALCSAWRGTWWHWARHFLFPWPHCLNPWQIGEPQGSLNLSAGAAWYLDWELRKGLSWLKAETWPLALASTPASSSQPSPPYIQVPAWASGGSWPRSRDGAAG